MGIHIQMHHRVAILFIIAGPFGQPWPIGIAGLREVAPIGLHQVGKLVVLRLPSEAFERIERSEHILDFRGMHGSEKVRCNSLELVIGISGTNAAEDVFINRLAAGLALHLNPFPCSKDDKLIARKIDGRGHTFLVRTRGVDLQNRRFVGREFLMYLFAELCRRGLCQNRLVRHLLGVPAGHQRYVALFA